MKNKLEQSKVPTNTFIHINTITPGFRYKNNLGVAIEKVQSAIKL